MFPVSGLVVLVLVLAGAARSHDLFYSYGLQEDDKLPYGADVSSPEIRLKVPIKFFDDVYDSLYVNGNGLISFLTEVPTFFNVQFPLEYPVIAPLYTHVDTTRSGTISYRETEDPDILERISDKVNSLYPNLVKEFNALSAFIVTWDKVGYFDRGSDKVNTYQAVISTDGDESFVEMLYAPNGVQWVQGVSKGQGLPDARAQAGIVAPDGRLYTLRGSGTDQIKNLDKWTNADAPGIYMFRIGNTGDRGNVELPQAAADDRASTEEEPKSCATGSIYCHSKADCFDTVEGFCCKCQPKFYGNGRNCFMDGIPLRVTGKVNISVNNISIQNLDLQAYVVTTDGRSYTALSQMPQQVGHPMQLVESLGGVIAWLFARPINDAKNGYQLTGGILNHTVNIVFDTNHRLLVKQRYLGLDVYDQLKMEAEVTGTLPNVEQGKVLKMPDFQEWFSKMAPGAFRSQSDHVVNVDKSNELYRFKKDEIIEFNEYCPEANQDITNLRLKSARNFINFDAKEEILRFSSTNKVSRSTGIEDPCIEGHANCVANSSCIVQEDTFKCVCNPGFETLYNDDTRSDIGCVDINECAKFTASCHENAICLNEVGSYSCQCKPGYSGDGRICEDLVSPCERDPYLCDISNGVCDIPGDHNSCNCFNGFRMVKDEYSALGFSCQDIDECETPVCHADADCYNTQGSYICTCKDGYYGDGLICTSERPAATCQSLLCPENSVCITEYESARCVCNRGYTGEPPHCKWEDLRPIGGSCFSLTCPEHSYCVENNYEEGRCICEPGYNGEPPYCKKDRNSSCSTDAECSNVARCLYDYDVSFYKCKCLPGYTGDGYECQEIEGSVIKTCQDGMCWCPSGYFESGDLCFKTSPPKEPPKKENDCSTDTECPEKARCVYDHKAGSYKCQCQPGYVGDGYNCQQEPNSIVKRCQDNKCWCHDGYHEIGDLCVKVTPSTEPPKEGPCGTPCDQNAKCIYVQRESEYICKCNAGFEGNGLTCTELEISCESAEICDKNAFCQYDDTNERYICICDIGFEGDGTTCYPTGECKSDEDCNYLESCEHNEQIDRYECMCRRGYSKGEDNECTPTCDENCHHDAQCVFNNELKKSVCLCRDGLEGDGISYCNPEVRGCDRDGCSSPDAECVYDSTLRTHKCQCSQGYEGDGENCTPTCYKMSDMCSEDASCSQIHGIFQCHCNEGFVGNGIKCRESKQHEEFLLVNQGRATLRVPFNQNRFNRGYPLHIHDGQTAIGIATDCVDGRVYWSDIANHTIRSSKYDGSDIEDFLTMDINSPEGLSIDWANRNIFWTDSELDTINVANLETKERKAIVTAGLVNPRGIAVHPWMRKVFWSDWNRDDPKIESSDLNGEGRKVLLRGPHVSLPNSLAIDWLRDDLCWADAGTQTIECINIPTNSRRTVVKGSQYPFGLAITSDKYYWTDWKTHKIEAASKEDGKQLQSLLLPLGGDSKLYGITAVTETCPQ